MYNSLDFLAKEEFNYIPGDIVHLLLKATQNIAYYSGLIRGYSHGEILKKVRYLINYKYSRFHVDKRRKTEDIILEGYDDWRFVENIHHLMFAYGVDFLQKSVEANDKLPLFEMIKFSIFLEKQYISVLEMTETSDKALKYQIEALWEMLSEVYACEEFPVMLKLVNFWMAQYFYDYFVPIKPLGIEIFELLLNQEILGTVSIAPNSIYINKAVMESHLKYISEVDSYQRELLKVLSVCFSDTDELLKDIDNYICEITDIIKSEFGDAKTNVIKRLMDTEIATTNRRAEEIMGVSTKTTIGYLKKLEKLKLLKSIKIGNSIYYFNIKIMKILDKY